MIGMIYRLLHVCIHHDCATTGPVALKWRVCATRLPTASTDRTKTTAAPRIFARTVTTAATCVTTLLKESFVPVRPIWRCRWTAGPVPRVIRVNSGAPALSSAGLYPIVSIIYDYIQFLSSDQGPDLYAFIGLIGFIGFIGPDDDDLNWLLILIFDY